MISAVEQQVDRRVAHLEGRAMEQTQVFEGIREAMRDIRQQLRSMEDRSSRQFMWMIGIQVTTLLTIMALLRR